MKHGKDQLDTSGLRKVLDFHSSLQIASLDVINEAPSVQPPRRHGVSGGFMKCVTSDSESGDGDKVFKFFNPLKALVYFEFENHVQRTENLFCKNWGSALRSPNFRNIVEPNFLVDHIFL